MRCFKAALLAAVGVLLLAGPVSADLARHDAAWSAPGAGFSPPVPLSRSDRLILAPAAGAMITVYVNMPSTWLNETERGMIMQTVQNKYGTVATLINFTTVKPTTGSYHEINVQPGRDPTTADGLVWGEAWSTTANIYGGEFTQDPNVSSFFNNSTARSNAIGENIAHELDHILRGAGHSRNPGDINCDGTLVGASARAADNRDFTEADKQQKIRNILNGTTYHGYGAKEEKVSCNVMPIFGGTGWPPELKPDCTWVSFTIETSFPPGLYRIGFSSEEGVWDFADGYEPMPGVYSIAVPSGVRLDFAVIDVLTGESWPLSDWGTAAPIGAPIDPLFSINPVVDEPYFSEAALNWNLPYGPAAAFVRTTAPEGLKVFPFGQGGVDDGDLSPTPRLLQNSPNPFTRTTEIGFAVPAVNGADVPVGVKLSVFDVRGRLVRVLVDEAMAPGPQRVTLDAEGSDVMASGIYFYRLEVAGESLTRKLLLLR